MLVHEYPDCQNVRREIDCALLEFCDREMLHKFLILLIPDFCPGGQRQRLSVNNSTPLVQNDSKKSSKPKESPHSVPGPCIQQNSLFVAA